MAETGEGGPSPVELETARVDEQFARIERESIPDPEKLIRRAALGRRFHLDLHNVLESHRRGRSIEPEAITGAAVKVLTAAKHEAFAQIPAASQFVLQKLLEQRLSPAAARALAPVIYDLATATPVRDNAAKVAEYLKGQYSKIRTHDPQLAQTVREAVGNATHYFGFSPARLDRDFPPPDEPPAATAGGAGGEGGGEPPEEPPGPDTEAESENGDEDGENEQKNSLDNKNLRDRRDELSSKANGYMEEFSNIYETAYSDFENRVRRRVSQEIQDKYIGDPNVTPEDIEREIEDEVQSRLSEFRSKYLRIVNSVSDLRRNERFGVEAGLKDAGATIADLLQTGYINQTTATELMRLVGRLADVQSELLEIYKTLGREKEGISNELSRAISQGQVEFPDGQLTLLYALDSPKSLAEYINSNERYLHAGTEWYKLFYQDVGEIFDTILSVASSQPNEPFMQNISMMYEGQLHKFLVGRLKTNLSRSLEQQKDEEYLRLNPALTGGREGVSLASFEVIEKQISSLPKESAGGPEEEVRGEELRAYEFDHIIPLFKGVEILGDKMAKNFERTQVLHDTEVAERLGAGFEELQKSAERLKTEDLDDMFHGNPNLAKAFRAYKQALELFLALHGHIITSDFGEIDKTLGMDNIQEMAYQTIFGNIKRNEGESDLLYERRVKGLVRQAAGLAKVTQAYHAQLLPRRLLISRTVEYQRDEHGNIIGIKSVKAKRTYVSGRIAALEQNLTKFDPRKLLDRFGIPQALPAILSAFSPRDKEHYKPWTDQHQHKDILRHAEENDEAFFIGRTPWLARLDRTQRTLGELAQIRTLDRFLRGGWREVQYDVYIVKENGVVNLERSIENLRRFGTIFVARLIDDNLGEFAKLERDDAFFDRFGTPAQADAVWEAIAAYKQRKNDTTKQQLKAVLYEKEVFDRLFAARPTQALAFEFPRFTPRSEFHDGNTVYQQTYRFLRSRFPDLHEGFFKARVLPFFVTALSSVENAEWDRRRAAGESLTYQINPAIINEYVGTPEQPGSLRSLYALYMNTLEKHDQLNTTTFNKDSYSFEQFVDDLTGFSEKIRQGVFETTRYKGVTSPQDEITTFSRRYADLCIVEEKEEILILLKSGHDVANEEYIQQQPGSRVHQRTLGEAKSLQSDVSPALEELFLSKILKLMRGGLNSDDEIKAAAKEINELVHKHVHLVESLHGEDEAHRDAIDWGIIIWDRLLGKDRKYRGSFGGLFGELNWAWRGGARSLPEAVYPRSPEMSPTALDTGEVYVGVESLLNEVGVPWKSATMTGYTDEVLGEKAVQRIGSAASIAKRTLDRIPGIGHRLSVRMGLDQMVANPDEVIEALTTRSNNPAVRWAFGILKPGKPILHHHDNNGMLAKRVIGARPQEYLIENWPTLMGVSVVVLIALALAARDKNKEK